MDWLRGFGTIARFRQVLDEIVHLSQCLGLVRFASFEGKRGQQYTLDMDFSQDGSKLSVANPKLRVGVHGTDL